LHIVCAACGTTNRVLPARLAEEPKCGKCHVPLLDGQVDGGGALLSCRRGLGIDAGTEQHEKHDRGSHGERRKRLPKKGRCEPHDGAPAWGS
jgi:hypothetical protein